MRSRLWAVVTLALLTGGTVQAAPRVAVSSLAPELALGGPGAMSYGASATIAEFGGGFGLEVGALYWQNTETVNLLVGSARLTTRDFGVAPSIRYRFGRVGSSITPVVMGGLGVHHLSISGHENVGASSSAFASGLGFGVHVAGGVEAPLGPRTTIGGLLRLHTGWVSMTQLVLRFGFSIG